MEQAALATLLPKLTALLKHEPVPEAAPEPPRPAASGALAERLAALPSAHRYDALLEAVQEMLAAVLTIDDPSLIEEDVSFLELGMDSLMGVQFGKVLMEALGIELDATLLFDAPNPGDLTRLLLSQLEGRGVPEGTDSDAPAPEPAAEAELAEADDLDALLDAYSDREA